MFYKSFFAHFILVTMLMAPVAVFAEDASPAAENPASAPAPETSVTPTPAPAQTPATCQQVVEEKFGDVLDTFFDILAQDQKKAYTMTSTEFRKNVKYVDFEDILSATDFAHPLSREWLDFDDSQPDLLRLTGAFVDSNNITHILDFVFQKDADQWRLHLFSETPAVAFYKKIFPRDEALQSLVETHIHVLDEAFRKKTYSQFFKTFLKIKTIIKRNALRNVFSQFRKGKLDIVLPENVSVAFDPCSPIINSQGISVVKGTYENAMFTVRFRFEYIYQWAWKMRNFNFSIDPIKEAKK